MTARLRKESDPSFLGVKIGPDGALYVLTNSPDAVREFAEFIRAEIAKTRSLFAFEQIWDNGYRQITSSGRAAATPADISGMKIRVPPSSMWTSLFSSLGAAPATINANELYSSLQTKIVDAQENEPRG